GAASVTAEPARVPEPRDVLEALQIAGIFERGAAAGERPVGRDRPERRRRRLGGLIAVIGLTVLFVAGGGGVFFVVKDRRAKAHLEAETLLTQVDRDLRASDQGLLEPSEQALARAFELDSRSPHAAL